MINPEKIDLLILEVMGEAGHPVTIGWVAEKIGVSWNTARFLLQDMVVSNKLKVIQTSRTAIFCFVVG